MLLRRLWCLDAAARLRAELEGGCDRATTAEVSVDDDTTVTQMVTDLTAELEAGHMQAGLDEGTNFRGFSPLSQRAACRHHHIVGKRHPCRAQSLRQLLPSFAWCLISDRLGSRWPSFSRPRGIASPRAQSSPYGPLAARLRSNDAHLVPVLWIRSQQGLHKRRFAGCD